MKKFSNSIPDSQGEPSGEADWAHIPEAGTTEELDPPSDVTNIPPSTATSASNDSVPVRHSTRKRKEPNRYHDSYMCT